MKRNNILKRCAPALVALIVTTLPSLAEEPKAAAKKTDDSAIAQLFRLPDWFLKNNRQEDKDNPINMDGIEGPRALGRYSIRRLMDTLRALRTQAYKDYKDKTDRKLHVQRIGWVKSALKQKGVKVDDRAIDDPDF